MIFAQLDRAAPVPISCTDCGVALGFVQLPDFNNAGRMLKTLNAGLGLLLDSDVDMRKLNPALISDSLKLRCPRCAPNA